jgi:hypothetical protein
MERALPHLSLSLALTPERTRAALMSNIPQACLPDDSQSNRSMMAVMISSGASSWM